MSRQEHFLHLVHLDKFVSYQDHLCLSQSTKISVKRLQLSVIISLDIENRNTSA